MAKAPTLPTITGSFASSAQLNAAFRDIEDAFDNTLSLDGSTPNSMNADLDMNGFDILNINTLQVEDLSVAGQPLDLLAAVEEANEAAADANSSASLAAASAASINLPSIAGKALNTLRVNAAATGYEHRTPDQALADLGITATASEVNAIDGVTAAGTALIRGADAAAQRTSLGLGTAALVNTGTTSGTLPLLTTGNKLTAAAMGQGNSTLVTLSGSNVDFTGIPSTARRVTLMFNGLSTNGTTVPLVQLGDAGGIEATGYAGAVSNVTSTTTATVNFTTGFAIGQSWAAAVVGHGAIVFELADAATNLWVVTSGYLARSDTAAINFFGGSKTLSEVLTQIRITVGANTFDAGTASIKWE